MNEKIVKEEATYDFLKDEVHCLYEEKKELQERIDKAIEQINWLGKCIEEDEGISWQVEYCDEIVDILKGDNKNG